MQIARFFLASILTLSAASQAVDLNYAVQPITLEGISSPMWESHPAIDPWNGNVWFVRSRPDFSGWTLWVSPCIRGALQKAARSPISSQGIEADPYFSPDGRTLYFISSRSKGSQSSADLDIWKATRNRSGEWQKPERMPSPVNSEDAEWFPRPASDGWLYFGSRRSGGFGKDDIWRAKEYSNGTWHIENLGPGVNTSGSEYEFLPAPDGRWGLLSTDNGLYRAERNGGGWQRKERLNAVINKNGTEIGPMFYGTDGAFVFSRDSGTGMSGELFLATPKSRVTEQTSQPSQNRCDPFRRMVSR